MDDQHGRTPRVLFGIEVDPTVFWAALFLFMTLFPSLLSHLPLLLGYGFLPALAGGLVGVVISVVGPVLIAHRSL